VVFDSAVQGFPGRRLERVIIEAFQGEQLPDGTVRSRGLIQRAAFTIETEVSVVSLDQQMQAIRAAGQQYIRWVTAQDEKVCPFCASRHGRIYLSDRITIPAHLRCRCMAVPVAMPSPDAAPDDGFWQDEYAAPWPPTPQPTTSAHRMQRQGSAPTGTDQPRRNGCATPALTMPRRQSGNLLREHRHHAP
jgi:SPP1 gp7 family putative phage head morphogenesis protein